MTKKEMQRIEQERINRRIENVIDVFNEFNSFDPATCPHKRLRSSSATVYDTGNFYVLQSYNTIVAIIDKNTDTLYDFLRLVYGFTSTSSQHINKFEKDYCKGKWSCAYRYQWRAC